MVSPRWVKCTVSQSCDNFMSLTFYLKQKDTVKTLKPPGSMTKIILNLQLVTRAILNVTLVSIIVWHSFCNCRLTVDTNLPDGCTQAWFLQSAVKGALRGVITTVKCHRFIFSRQCDKNLLFKCISLLRCIINEIMFMLSYGASPRQSPHWCYNLFTRKTERTCDPGTPAHYPPPANQGLEGGESANSRQANLQVLHLLCIHYSSHPTHPPVSIRSKFWDIRVIIGPGDRW